MRARYRMGIGVARLLLRLPTTATVLAAAGIMVAVAAAATGEAAQRRAAEERRREMVAMWRAKVADWTGVADD